MEILEVVYYFIFSVIFVIILVLCWYGMIFCYFYFILFKFRFVWCFFSNIEFGIGVGDFDSLDIRLEFNKVGIMGVYNI